MRITLILIALLGGLALVATGEEPKLPHGNFHYQLMVESDQITLINKPDGKKKPPPGKKSDKTKIHRVSTRTIYHYSLERKTPVVVLKMNSLEIQAHLNEKVALHQRINRQRIRRLKDGKFKVTFSFDADPVLRKFLEDSFDQPLCRILLNRHGKEINRQFVGGTGARGLMKNGMIDHLRLFHSPYFSGKKSWTVDRILPAGQGSRASGKLKYQPQAPQGDLVPVQVTGVLQGKFPVGKYRVPKAEYKVTGLQYFHLKKRVWMRGVWNLTVQYNVFAGTKKAGQARGKLKITLTSRKPKKI